MPTTTKARKNTAAANAPKSTAEPKITRGDALIALMRSPEGASAADLAAAVGWQVHSVRGFISGNLKKRADLEVITLKGDDGTRYHVRPRAEAAS